MANNWSNDDASHTRLMILESQVEFRDRLLCNCKEENERLKQTIYEMKKTQENNHINIERKLSNIRLEIREILDSFI